MGNGHCHTFHGMGEIITSKAGNLAVSKLHTHLSFNSIILILEIYPDIPFHSNKMKTHMHKVLIVLFLISR